MLRTTTAVTMLEASPQENVLAQEAVATVNFRIVPGETIESVEQRVVSIVGNEHVEVRPAASTGFRSNPSAVASIDTPGYAGLERAIAALFPDALVMPGLVIGATDSRHFQAVADDTYRFAPLRIAREQASGVHGTDERVAIDALGPAVQFYIHLFETELGDGR
jgi:carboxypeptidase PM20D1